METRRGIHSMETGLVVLQAVAEAGRPLQLGEAARRSGLSPSQAHRYLVSLAEAGLIRQDIETRRYDLGPGALRLGLAALGRRDILPEAEREVAAFVSASGRTVQLAALGPQGPVVVRHFAGATPTATSQTIGSLLPLGRSVGGQVFLAFGGAAQIERLLARETPAQKNLTPVNLDRIRTWVRRKGYASDEAVLTPGLRTFAAPIFDTQGEAVLAAIMLAHSVVGPGDDGPARASLTAACARATEAIGGVCPGTRHGP